MVGKLIASNLQAVRKKIEQAAERSGRKAHEITLIGVTKKKSIDDIIAALEAGLRDFAENYWQEAEAKLKALAQKPIHWHYIGHLQSNKARFVCGAFDLIHSVDRFEIIKALNSRAESISRVQKVLLQVNIAGENEKSGCASSEAPGLIKAIQQTKNLQLTGIMAMPPMVDKAEQNRKAFAELFKLKEKWKSLTSAPHSLTHYSAGTTQDFEVAIEEGATMVRLGTSIFGER